MQSFQNARYKLYINIFQTQQRTDYPLWQVLETATQQRNYSQLSKQTLYGSVTFFRWFIK